jgi:hypothetical protein
MLIRFPSGVVVLKLEDGVVGALAKVKMGNRPAISQNENLKIILDDVFIG